MFTRTHRTARSVHLTLATLLVMLLAVPAPAAAQTEAESDPDVDPVPSSDEQPADEPGEPADDQDASEPSGESVSALVKFVSGVSGSERASVIERHGGTEVSSTPPLRLHVVEIAEDRAQDTVEAFEAEDSVEYAELDQPREVEASPSDPAFDGQWALPRIGWDEVFGSVDPAGRATIAVLDTGVDASDADLEGVVTSGFSAVEGGNPTADPNGHGTAVASIAAAATDNGHGIAGVAYAGVQVAPVTVLDADGVGWDSDVIEGVVWAADNGADVILMAFSNPGYSRNLQDAVDYAWSKGAVLVAATGNDGSSTVTYPAGTAKVMGVSATNKDDALWSGSNHGSAAFLAAPGVDIASGTGSVTGTSASAAVVAGAAALVKANDSSASNGVVVGRLARNADPAGSAEQTGNGRVNLTRAVADDSTETVAPAGAAPDGPGGPFVGPYEAAGNATITGTVTDSVTGLPIANASVTCSDGCGGTTTTAANGTYSFQVNSPGSGANGTVTASKDGYTPATSTFSTGSNNQTFTRNFALAPTCSIPAITAQPQSTAKIAGESAVFSVTASGTGPLSYQWRKDGDDIAGATSGTYTIQSVSASDAADYRVVVSNDCGSVTSSAATLSVGKATPDITWEDPEAIVYGTPLGEDQLNAEADVAGEFDYEPAGGTVLGAGDHTLDVTFTPDDTANYSTAAASVELRVEEKALTVSVEDSTKAYGAALPSFSVDYDGFVPGDDESVLDGELEFDTDARASSPVGSYAVTPSGLTSDNYDIRFVAGTLEVIAARIVVTTGDAERGYGDANPVFTGDVSGVVEDDDITVTWASAADELSAVGDYPITATVHGDPELLDNYELDVSHGTLTVTKASLTVTADNQTRAYGEANPELTGSVAGLKNDDDITANFVTTATSGSSVGEYGIAFSSFTDPDNRAGNYNVTSVDGTLTVTAASLTVTTVDAAKVYGDANPRFTVTYEGFADGDDERDLEGELSFVTDADETSSVGQYAVTPAGLTAENYDVAFRPGTLTVTPAGLTVTANNTTKVYGSENPTFSASYDGFVNDDGPADLGGDLDFDTEAAKDSTVGDYGVTPSGLTSSNYAITFEDGTLSVTMAPLTVTANDETRAYGAANPAFTVSYDGFVLEEDASVLGGGLEFDTDAGASSSVGDYAVTPKGLTSNNYEIRFVAGTLTVTAAELVVTTDDTSREYGDANPEFTGTLWGVAAGDDISVTWTSDADEFSPVDEYEITATLVDPDGRLPNYDVTVSHGTLTVTLAPLTVTAHGQTKVYGDANPALTGTVTGQRAGDQISANFKTAAVKSSPVDSYDIVFDTWNDADGRVRNYDVTYVDGTLEVTPAALTVTTVDVSKVYGEANPDFTVIYEGFVLDEDEDVLGGGLTFSTDAGASSPVGTYDVTPSGLNSDNYTITFVEGTLSVTPKALTVTADDQSKVYGEENPIFSVSYDGFVLQDGPADLGGELAFSTNADDFAPVGEYVIAASGLISDNYEITFEDGTLTVTPATLTVTADAVSKVYGDANPVFTVSYSGFVLGEGEGVLGGDLMFGTDAGASSPVGDYDVTPSGLTSNNYAITFVKGTLTVTKAPLTVTAHDRTKVYGDDNPELTGTVTGQRAGDVISASFMTAAVKSSPVGSYDIVFDTWNDADDRVGNYDVTFEKATLSVTPAELTVTTDDASKVYGDPNPAFTVSYDGFVLEEDETVLGGDLDFATDADESSTVGHYDVTPSGLTSDNYAITFVEGRLSVIPAPLTAKTVDVRKVYGAAMPDFTVEFSGFVLEDDAGVVVGAPEFATSADEESPVGDYLVTPSGLTSPNYAISFEPGTLTVTPAALTVAADDVSKVYGEQNPAFTVSYHGFVLDEDEDVLGGELDFATDADESSSVGNYAVTPSGLTSDNYTIAFEDGTLTVTRAELTVTADDVSKVYGEQNPAFTVSYDGFVLDEDEEVLAGDLDFATDADEESPVGNYPVTPSGLTSDNYDINFEEGTLTVTEATLTVTADDTSRRFGEANPAFTWVIGGFVNDETEQELRDSGDLSGAPECGTEADEASEAGDHVVECGEGSLTAANYQFEFVDGTLTIQPLTLEGYDRPVEMTPVDDSGRPVGNRLWNTVKGGQTVPLKFQVFNGSTEVTDTAIVRSLTRYAADCGGGTLAGDIDAEPTGGTTLRYSGKEFIFNWSVPKGANKCYEVVLTTVDGSELHGGFFKTK